MIEINAAIDDESHSYMPANNQSFLQSFLQSFKQSFMPSLIQPFIQSFIETLQPGAEEFVAEEIKRSHEDDSGVVSGLQGGDEEGVLADGVRKFLDLLVGVEGVGGGGGRQHRQHQRVVHVGGHADPAVQILVGSARLTCDGIENEK